MTSATGLPKRVTPDWLARLADFFQDAEALGFELGDGDFLHESFIPWSMTMVKLNGQACHTGSVLHWCSVMKAKLRNVTVTLEEKVARWARVEAARQDTSVSRLLADILKERMREKDSYDRAMREALARKPFLKTDGRYLSREEVHDRTRLR